MGTQEISQEEEGVGSIDSNTPPAIPGSDVPALLGNASLRKLDAIIECGLGRLRLQRLITVGRALKIKSYLP